MSSSGILFGMAVVPLIFADEQCSSTPQTGCWQQPLIAVFFSILHMHGCLQLAWFGREGGHLHGRGTIADGPKETGGLPADAPPAPPRFTENDTIPMLMSTYLNRPFRCLLLSAVAKAAGQDVPLNLMPFMTQWGIGEKCIKADLFFGILVVTNVVCTITALPIWMWLASCIGKFRAYVCFTVALGISSLLFLIIEVDNGDCTMSYLAIVCVALWGMAFGGSFLMKDLVCDSIDYDEFLCGGRRREASYLMSVEFVPKFVNIPGECVPFLMMAYANYQRPLQQQIACGSSITSTTLSTDEYCSRYLSAEPAGAHWCSKTKTCAEYLASGVNFYCADAVKVCTFQQNIEVRWVLRLCFSLVPGACVLMSLCALYFYPKRARTEANHEALIDGITKMRRGQKVKDPWQDGIEILSVYAPGPNDGTLSYFWPHELLRVLEAGSADEEDINIHVATMRRRPLTIACIFLLIIPVGVFMILIGLEDLSTDLGASVSPLGLMLVGIGLVGVWFQGIRTRAANELRQHNVTRTEVLAKYNQLCPFIGRAPIISEFSKQNSTASSIMPTSSIGSRGESSVMPTSSATTTLEIHATTTL